MDDLDQRLQGRLERLAEAVPVAAAAPRTEPVRRAPLTGRQPGAIVAMVAVVVVAVTAGLFGVSAFRQAAPPPSSSGAAVPSGGSEMPTASVAASPTPSQAASTVASPTASPSSPAGPSADRYADGIPRQFGGEPVLRGPDALERAARAAKAGDTKGFLVGGWATQRYASFGCLIGSSPHGWIACGQPRLSDQAGAFDETLSGAIVWRFLPDAEQPSTGPIVVSVHVNDPRSSECAYPDQCAGQMVVSSVEWTGDEATAPGPIDAAGAVSAASRVDVRAKLVPDGPSVGDSGCGGFVPGAPRYLSTSGSPRVPGVMSITVAPTAAALARALPAFADGAAGVWAKKAWLMSAGNGGAPTFQCRMLRVANVMVEIELHPGQTTADEAFVERLAAALEAAR